MVCILLLKPFRQHYLWSTVPFPSLEIARILRGGAYMGTYPIALGSDARCLGTLL
jgi:hypothetical protein